MFINDLPKNLEKSGLPIFWQYFMLVHITLVLLLVFPTDPFWVHLISIVLKPLTLVGVIAGYIYHKQKPYPWIFLISAVAALVISDLLKPMIYFGLAIDPFASYWAKQIGVLFIVIFGINILLLFEQKNNLRGFTLDFMLLVLSGIILVFLIFPDFLNAFLYELSIYHQIALIHLVVAIAAIVLVVLNFIFISSVQFKDIVLFLLVVLISSHFLFEAFFVFNVLDNNLLNTHISTTLYRLSGSVAIITIFVERLKLDFVTRYTSKAGTFFLWIATVVALTVIPFGIIYRWIQKLEPLNPIIVAFGSLALVFIIIIRYAVLVNNSNRHRKTLMDIALKDELTKANNYLGFHEKYSIIAKQNSVIIAINIEDFRSINDLYGREFGNEVLKSLVKRLKSQANLKIVARMGADTFIVFMQVPQSEVKKESVLLHEILGVWDSINDERIAVPLTFGVACSVKKVESEVLIKQAETALYVARQKRISYYFYAHDLESKSLHRNELRGILQKAIDYDYLPVHFQPIYNIDDGSLKAIELLIRVQSKEHGLLLPGQFLEQAQSYGLLTSLTRVCVKMIAVNLDKLPDVTININIPSYILDDSAILNEFILGFKQLKLSPKRFCIEVMEDEDIPADHLLNAVMRLKKEGFTIAMDDFGTGYSSLSRLSLLPFDTVKIDRSVLLAASTGNKAILESSITLIKRLGLTVVVEGVETLEQLALVRLLGADSVQGYLFSKPISLEKTSLLPLNAASIVEEF